MCLTLSQYEASKQEEDGDGEGTVGHGDGERAANGGVHSEDGRCSEVDEEEDEHLSEEAEQSR